MARTAQTDLFVARLLAMAFAALSGWATCASVQDHMMLIVAQGCTVVSIGVMAGVRARVGWRSTYAPLSAKLTLALWIPAQLATALCAVVGLRM